MTGKLAAVTPGLLHVSVTTISVPVSPGYLLPYGLLLSLLWWVAASSRPPPSEPRGAPFSRGVFREWGRVETSVLSVEPSGDSAAGGARLPSGAWTTRCHSDSARAEESAFLLQAAARPGFCVVQAVSVSLESAPAPRPHLPASQGVL